MKKRWLRDRKVAIVITIIIMILSTGFGAHRSLENRGEYAEWVFYHGSYGDGGGIQSELDTRAGLASNLLIVAGRYLDDEDEAVQRLKNAREALVQAENIGEKYIANEELSQAADNLAQVLNACSLTENDRRYQRGIIVEMESANEIIGHDEYNTLANAYNRNVLGSFPANILKEIVGVEELETFN